MCARAIGTTVECAREYYIGRGCRQLHMEGWGMCKAANGVGKRNITGPETFDRTGAVDKRGDHGYGKP